MSPFHSCLFLARPHHDCLTTYHPTFSIQSPPFHYCLTTPDHTNPLLCTLPALPFRSLPSRSRPFRSSATFLPYHTVNNHSRPILDCQIIPRRTAKIHYEPFHGCLIAPHHASRIQSLPLLPLQNPSSSFDTRPIHELPVLCTFPALPFRSLTCRSRPIRSSANLPNQASPNETSPDLDCRTKLHLLWPFTSSPFLDCQTTTYLSASHLNKPARTLPRLPYQNTPV